jgi:hypothetical protein
MASGNAVTMPSMRRTDQTIPIQTDTPHAGCQVCLPGQAGPTCPGVSAGPSLPPRLVGPPEELQRLLAALAPRLGFELVPGGPVGPVRALAVSPGEVTLELAVGRQCGGQGLIDSAFQTLRSLLPDTDIYVTHAD